MMKTLVISGVVFAVLISGCSKHGKQSKILAGPMLPMKRQQEDLKRVAAPEAPVDKTEKAPAAAAPKAGKSAAKKARQAAVKKNEQRKPASAHKAKHRSKHHRKAARKAHRAAHAKKRAAASESDEHASVAAAADTVKE